MAECNASVSKVRLVQFLLVEDWVHYFGPENNAHSVEFGCKALPVAVPEKFKNAVSVRRVMPTVCWNVMAWCFQNACLLAQPIYWAVLWSTGRAESRASKSSSPHAAASPSAWQCWTARKCEDNCRHSTFWFLRCGSPTTLPRPADFDPLHTPKRCTRWRSWLRHYATNQKVAGSIPDGVSGIFHWHVRSGRTMALGVYSASNRNEYQECFVGDKGGRCVGLTTLPRSCADFIENWETQSPGILRACLGL
jgi:rRNA maturation protein Nop10